MKEYKIPESEPIYNYVRPKKIKKPHVYLAFDRIFAVYGFLLTFAYTLMLFLFAVKLKVLGIGFFLVFWGVLTYVALPRFHSLLSLIYVPEYFIARTKTGTGILGDPVNLAICGTEEDIHGAMRRAGWVEPDPITVRSAAGIVKSTVKHVPYPAAPVSNLYLFDRKQDFAYQKDVDGSAAKRHHVRFWKVPEGWSLPGGKKVDYLAAGTFDRGVGLTTSTLQFTHKIDGDIDKERDYIIDTLRYNDNEIEVQVVEQFSSPYHDKNGGGDAVFTDGNMPILDLHGCSKRSASYIEKDKAKSQKEFDPMNQELPPKSLFAVGLFLLIKIIIAAVAIIAFAVTFRKGESFNKERIIVLGVVLVGLIVQFILYFCTVHKYKWARLILLIFASLNCTFEIAAYYSSRLDFSNIISSGISVILVLVLSSPDIRQWVYERPGRGR